jgi:transposase
MQGIYPEGLSKFQILKRLGVCRSTYYGWVWKSSSPSRKTSPWQLTRAKRQAVIQRKEKESYLSHREISGRLRTQGYWVSFSSCYRLLKPLEWVSAPTLREAPWKVPWYEPFRPNQIWGEDWTILSIEYRRHYLLTIIDCFSRYIVAWGVVKTVTRLEVQNPLTLAT